MTGEVTRRALLAAATGLSATAPPRGTVMPSRRQVLDVIRRVNDHWIDTHQRPGGVGWARSTYMSGCMAAYAVTREPRYLSYVRGWAQDADYRLVGGPLTRDADAQCAGQVYYDLYAIDRDPHQIRDINASVRSMVSAGAREDWSWVDALYMSMPVFARASRYFSNDDYLRAMFSLYSHTADLLYDRSARLWFRDVRFVGAWGERSPYGSAMYWLRGNGWAFAAQTKTLSILGAQGPGCAAYEQNLREMASALLLRQRPDGFWNADLGSPQNYPGPETSGTALALYALAQGVRSGRLPRRSYLPVVLRAWQGLSTRAVHRDGSLGYVQGTADRPSSRQPVGPRDTADFGVGAFLLAAAEMARLAR